MEFSRPGSLSLLQGIFPTQGSNQGLLHCRQLEKQNDSSLVTKAKSRTYTSLLHKACFPLLSGSRPKPLMWNKGCSLALLSLALPPCPLLSKCQHLLSSACFSKLLCRFLCHELTSSIYPKHVTCLHLDSNSLLSSCFGCLLREFFLEAPHPCQVPWKYSHRTPSSP